MPSLHGNHQAVIYIYFFLPDDCHVIASCYQVMYKNVTTAVGYVTLLGGAQRLLPVTDRYFAIPVYI